MPQGGRRDGRDELGVDGHQVQEHRRDDDRQDGGLETEAFALGRRLARDRAVRPGGLAQRGEDLAGCRRRLLGPGSDDQRVVHEPQVPAGLTAPDHEECVAEGLVGVVAGGRLVEVRAHPAVTSDLRGGREEIGIRPARGRAADHGAQYTGRLVISRSRFGADQIPEVRAREQEAEPNPDGRDERRQQQPEQPQDERPHHAERDQRPRGELEPCLGENLRRIGDPPRPPGTDLLTDTRRVGRWAREERHEAEEDRDAGEDRRQQDGVHR